MTDDRELTYEEYESRKVITSDNPNFHNGIGRFSIDKECDIAKEDVKSENKFHSDVVLTLRKIKKMLLEKNRKYENSALEPVRVFSKASSEEQILVRIDDKLSRIKNRQNDEDDDVISDLIGYLVLLQIVRKDK